MPASDVSRITIKHPGYSGNSKLFALPASEKKFDRAHGLYHTVLVACGIVANNHWDGWLSRSKEREPRVEPDEDGLIPAGVYFYHLDSGDQAYSIVPNFRAWVFPHDDLPSSWQHANQLTLPCGPRSQVESCRISDTYLACETAHIIPASEKSWFADNEMDQYGELGGRTGYDVADSPPNSMRLRADLHTLWDSLYFSFIPRKSATGVDGSETWRIFSMCEDPEFHDLWHNKATRSLTGRPVQYLFARFAYNLFPKVLGFLQSTQPRWLAVRQADGQVISERLDPEECLQHARNQGPGRSASPTKRSRSNNDRRTQGLEELGYGDDCKRNRWSTSRENSADSAVFCIDPSDDDFGRTGFIAKRRQLSSELAHQQKSGREYGPRRHLYTNCTEARGRKRIRMT